MVFDSLAAVLAAPVVGDFHSDREMIFGVSTFIQDAARPLSDRACAARFLASEVYGFSGADAGEGMPDAEVVAVFMSDCS